jgi:hypothetical protein
LNRFPLKLSTRVAPAQLDRYEVVFREMAEAELQIGAALA